MYFTVRRDEIEALLLHFRDITNGKCDRLDKAKVRDMLHEDFGITDDVVMDRSMYLQLTNLIVLFAIVVGASFLIKNALFKIVLFITVFRVLDKDGDGSHDMKEYVRGINLFLQGADDERSKCT